MTAFSAGLLDGGVAPALKHFPGLGLAIRSTDDAAVTIGAGAGRACTRPRPLPSRDRGRRRPARDDLQRLRTPRTGADPPPGRPASSRSLRGLGFAGVTVTDALEPLATTHRVTLAQAAIRAARAGVDLLLFVGSERSTAAVYDALVAEARAGRLPRAGLEASAARIEELAATYAG